jgi:hypothetical protein
MSTADEVVSALRSAHKLRDVGDGKYRSASPYRTGSDSDAFSLTIDGPEHGKWFDHVANKGGSLYTLAKHLGVVLPTIAPSIDTKTATTHQGYAESHGLTLEALKRAGWAVGEHQRRPCFIIDTKEGKRYRYIDGDKPVFKSIPGYKQCLYKFPEAIAIAAKGGFPLVLCNGEASTVAAQEHGVAAFSVTGGGEKAMPEALLEEVCQAYKGEIVIAMDCDTKGKQAAAALRTQLRSVGYKVRVVNLGLSNKGDLADYMRLWSADDLYNLEDVYDLEFVAALPTIYSAADMQKEDVAPVEYIVDDIMTTGCYILAGAPKSRKSFLALHVAVSIANGKPVFGQFEVKTKCSVLYLDLEMSKKSVHRRLSSMNFGDWPKNLYFGFNQDWPNRGVLAGQDLENRLDNNPDIRVVIIDVLAQWREPVDPRTPVYSSDYDALKQIQRIAQRRNITIIVVHHTNKTKITKDDNPFDKISGSTGISGAVDAMWLLTRDPESEYASILRMTDRNIAGVDRVDLAWDDMLGSHVVDPKSKLLAATGPERRAVYDVMIKNQEYTWAPREIATELKREESVIKKHLRRLLEDKLVLRVGYGRYSAVPLTNIVHSGNSSTSSNSGNSIHSSIRVNENGIESEQELPRVNESESRVNGGFEAIESIKHGKSEQSEQISIREQILSVLGDMALSATKVRTDLQATGVDVSLSDVINALNDLVKQKVLTYEDLGTLRRYRQAHA